MKALVTGSGGLIGSECVRLLAEQHWEVVGIDNNMRQTFFGKGGSTVANTEALKASVPRFRHYSVDIRNRQDIRDLIEKERPRFIIHTAAQPSHDKAASIPYLDFDVNAVGTMNMLVAARHFCPESPFCFTSTNKVYGDRPNHLPLIEWEERYDYADGREGVDENTSIDQCLHSLFGGSKAAADLMCQEFGRYFGLPVGIFRGGCLTGPQHAAVELHGYLAYIVMCSLRASRTRFTVTRASRFAIKSIAAMWRGSLWNFLRVLAVVKCITLAGGAKTVSPYWKRYVCCGIAVLRSTIATTRQIGRATTFATFPTLRRFAATFPVGSSNTI